VIVPARVKIGSLRDRRFTHNWRRRRDELLYPSAATLGDSILQRCVQLVGAGLDRILLLSLPKHRAVYRRAIVSCILPIRSARIVTSCQDAFAATNDHGSFSDDQLKQSPNPQ
jgi:hypothetical protein